MSRHQEYPYRNPPTERWDGDRFARERNGRTVTAERDTFEEWDRYRNDDRGSSYRREISADEQYRRGGPRGGSYEDDRFYEREERYGPPARRQAPREEVQRRYHEEDDFESYGESPRRYAGRRPAPPRPGQLIRRQSSLDTFDRRPLPKYHEPEVVTVPAPRGGRAGQERHRYEPRYAERDYDDIGIAEPDWYGDEKFRGWKERETEVIRKRRTASPGVEEVKETEIIQEEKPWPRRGKTRMSARLVNRRALVQLGYPYEDEFTEQGDFVIILKALNKELIDEVLGLSKEFNEKVTLRLEAPPAEETIVERREIIVENPAEIPRSVRDWDVMSGAIEKSQDDKLSVARSSKSKHSRRSKSAHGKDSDRADARSERISVQRSEHRSSHRSRRSSSSESTVKRRHSRSPSPIVIERKRSKSRRRSRSSAAVKREIVEDIGESNSIRAGPLALVVPHHERSGSKDERRIKEEIRELEEEKRRLKKERRERKYRDDSDEEVIIERIPSNGRDRRDSTVKVEKDRKDSRAMKAMLATLT